LAAYSWAGIVVLALAMALVVFVAAAEAGLISISRARVRLMAGQGVPRADILQSYIQERESLLHALALARNLAILASASLAVAILTYERGHSWLMIGVAVLVALLLIAILEAVPRAIVARSPERWGLRLSPFMGGFKFVFGGAARILDLPMSAVAHRKVDEDEEEMLRLIELEDDEGDLEEDERRMIRGVFGLEDTTVREIMTPRTDIAAVDTESTPEDVVRLVIERGFSRVPLYEKNADTIVGLVYAKDLFRYLADGTMPTRLRDIARPAFFVPESMRVDDLLTEMRKRRVHMAIVVDEYGGTAGLVTIEDLLEEIVGEIEDEYDKVEEQIILVSETEAVLDGRVSIDELNELFHISIDAEDFDTVGGCVFHLLGRVPVAGDEAHTGNLRLHVLSVDGHRVKRVRAILEPKPKPENGNGNDRNGKNGNGREAEKKNEAT
jgi:CBS domain containing-hemolysin-like protein